MEPDFPSTRINHLWGGYSIKLTYSNVPPVLIWADEMKEQKYFFFSLKKRYRKKNPVADEILQLSKISNDPPKENILKIKTTFRVMKSL